jgi:DNA-binding transcriptional MerR regulator
LASKNGRWLLPASESLVSGFTRQEVIKLTGCTSSRLAYLEKVGMVVPQRVGPSKRPVVLFTWEQLLGVRVIKDLRKEVSLQTVRTIIENLNANGCDDSLTEKLMVAMGDEVLWIKDDWADFGENVLKAFKADGTGTIKRYSMVVLPPLSGAVNEIWEAAEKNRTTINFDHFKQRAKALPKK